MTAGEQVEFVLVLSNSGPSDAVNVVLEDIMPSYIHDAQFSTDNGNSWNVWEDRFEAGTLVPGNLVTVLIRGTVAASAVGIIENTAHISSDTEDRIHPIMIQQSQLTSQHPRIFRLPRPAVQSLWKPEASLSTKSR